LRRLGAYSWFGFSIPLEERFRLMKLAGFDSTFLWWGDEYVDTDGPKERHPDIARGQGLQLENVHLPFSDANELWTDSLGTEELMKVYSKAINDCCEHGIPTAVMHITRGYEPPPMTRKGMDRVKMLVELAEKSNVNIALEHLRRPEYLEFLLSGVDSARLGFCYDSGHEHCYTKGEDFLPQYGSRLMVLHLHDNDGSDDQHLVPGEGKIDWPSVAGKLKAARYTDALTFEVTSEFSSLRGRETPEEFLRRAYTAAVRIRDMIE
jgi:sugar phosphate isomerase/epimerase